MRLGRCSLCVLALLSGVTARADLTLRHSFTFKFAAFVPPEIQSQAGQQMKAVLPDEVLVRVKGDRVYSSFGPLFTVTDYGHNQITLLNPKSKEFATVPLNEYFDRVGAAQQIPALPPEVQRALGDLNFDVQTRMTGQASMIQGMRAEENVLVLAINAPGLQGVPSAMRLEMQFWVAQAAGIRGLPALRELADYAERAQRAFDPAQMIQKTFSMLPGMSNSLRAPLEQLIKANNGLVLKVHSGVYIPALAQLLSLSGQAPDGVDRNGPLAEFQMELSDISDAPIDDSVFAIPADYQAAQLEKLIQAEIQAPPLVPTVTPPKAPR